MISPLLLQGCNLYHRSHLITCYLFDRFCSTSTPPPSDAAVLAKYKATGVVVFQAFGKSRADMRKVTQDPAPDPSLTHIPR